jgi:hypothetical protein
VRALDGVLAPDLTMPAVAPLRMTHRRVDGREVYFVINGRAGGVGRAP